MLNAAPEWLCRACNPVSRFLGWALFGDHRPLCAIAYERCPHSEAWWRFARFVGLRHASESWEVARRPTKNDPDLRS